MPFATCILLFIMFSTSVYSQREAENWYFDNRSGISFASGSPIALRDGKINTLEGCATISNKYTGELLFYTDGVTVWNKYHEIMPNGTGLKGGNSSTQSALIVPYPYKNNEYFLFTAPDLTGNTGFTELCYSVVSMKNPQGNVLQKNISVRDSVGEKLCGTIYCDDNEFWVLTHHHKKAIFYAYHIGRKGIDTVPVVSDFGDTYNSAIAGYLKVSPQGNKIATGMGVLMQTSALYLFDFDRKTGKVYNRKKIDEGISSSFYGISFSPDGSKLYAIHNGLMQYDLSIDDENAIKNSQTLIANISYGALQIAHDKKIYTPFAQGLAAIEKPNEKGALCRYKENAVNVITRAGLPNFMDYIFNTVKYIQCIGNMGTIDTVHGCIGQTLTIIHSRSENIEKREWKCETGSLTPLNDTTVHCTFLQSGKHNITLTIRSNDITDTIFGTVIIHNNPIAYAGKDTVLCGVETHTVAIGDTAINEYTYSWLPADKVDNATISNPKAIIQNNTTFVLTVTNAFGCIDRDTIVISLQELPELLDKDSLAICEGETVQLQARGAESYEWSPSEGLNNPTIFNPITSPNKTTLYYVQGIIGNCTVTDSVLITVLHKPIISVTDNKTICEGESIQLEVSGADSYEWSPDEGISNTAISNPIITPEKTNLYYVKGTKNNCESRDSILITVLKRPTIIVSDDTTICESTSAYLFADGADTYEWSPNEGLNNPNIPNPIAKPTVTTEYTVRGSINNCSVTKTITVTVQQPTPTPIVIYVPDSVRFAVGSIVPITVEIPKGIDTALFTIYFDDCCLSYEQSPSDNSLVFVQNKGSGFVTFSAYIPDGYGAEITARFLVLLPPDGRLQERISVKNIRVSSPCIAPVETETEIRYNPTCAWDIRGVHGSEKFDIVISGEQAILWTGLGGETSISIYDMTGQGVWKAENTYPSSSEIEITLPELSGGVYILRVSNYSWKKDIIMVRE